MRVSHTLNDNREPLDWSRGVVRLTRTRNVNAARTHGPGGAVASQTAIRLGREAITQRQPLGKLLGCRDRLVSHSGN